MRKARDIVGLPVLDIQTGTRIGEVRDFMFGPDLKPACILLETRTWFTAPRSILCENVRAFGEDAVTVEKEAVVVECPMAADNFFLLDGESKLIGRPVLTQNGQELGCIEDVYLPENVDKRIVGFELSEGFLSDVTGGRKWMPCPEDAVVGADAVVVPVHCHQEVRPLTNNENG